MNTRVIVILAVCAAIVAGSVGGIVITHNRESIAQSAAEKATALADKADAERRKAEKQENIEKLKAQTAKASAEEAASKAQVLKEERAKADVEAKTALENRKIEEAKAEQKRADADKAQALKDAEAEKAQAARLQKEAAAKNAEAEAEKAKAEQAKLETEKLKSEKIIAESKLIEQRQLDLNGKERELIEWQQDLEERERAIQPEKTIENLSWAGGKEDTVFDEDGKIVKKARVVVLPEDDPDQTEASRKLSKVERELHEAETNELAKLRVSVVSALEKLYVQALKDHRVIDAESYRKNILSLYPDWKYSGE